MKLVLGRPKTGKTTELFYDANEALNFSKKVIYFVPSQMRQLAETNYMDIQNKCGILDINFTTISSFVNKYITLKLTDNKDKYMSATDRKLILSMLVNSNTKNMKIFHKVKNKEGFIENLSIYMDIFKKQELDVDKIDNLELDNKLLERKLKEISGIYKMYDEYTKEKYIDSLDEMDLFLDAFENDFKNGIEDINEYKFIFDSYNNFSVKELNFIRLLLALDADVTFAITSDIEDKINENFNINNLDLASIRATILDEEISSMFNIPNLTIYSLIKEAKKLKKDIICNIKYINHLSSKDDIKFLATNVYMKNDIEKCSSDNIDINLLPNMYSEAAYIINNICDLVKNKGYKYSDIAIAVSNPEEYNYVASKVFLEHNVPLHIDFKHKVSSNFLVIYIVKLLELVIYGFKKDTLLEVLKTGFLDISSSDISYLENYMLEFNIEGYKFFNEFRMNNKMNSKIYDLNKLNEIREKVIINFKNIVDLKTGSYTTKEILESLYSHFKASGILEKYFENIELLKESTDSKVMYLAKINEEGYSYIVEVFNSIEKVYMDKEVTLNEFLKLFVLSIKDLKVKSIEPTLDEVVLVDINSTKISNKKIIFFAGMNEDIFPLAVSNDILFDDYELIMLDEEEIKLKELTSSKINMQLYNFYEYVNNVTDKVYFTYLSSSLTGTSLKKSIVIEEVESLINVNIKKLNFAIHSKLDAFDKLTKNVKEEQEINKSFTNETLAIYRYLIKNKEYEDALNYKRETIKLNEETVKRIYNEEINLSVSRLELFSKCNFAYYLKYNLKLDERKVYSITTMDVGSLMHDIVEKFSLHIFSNNIMWHEILLDMNKYMQVAEKIIIEEITKTFSKHEENIKFMILKQKLISTMKRVIAVIATSFNQSKFVPLGYEIEFKEDTEYLPIEIELSNNKLVRLIGKIDRVDILETEEAEYIRIVDYKSSNKSVTVQDIKDKISLQLITYLSAIINSKNKTSDKKVLPAGMMYFTLSEKLLNLKEYLDDEDKIKEEITKSLKMNGIFLKDIEILKLMDKEVSSKNSLIDVSMRAINSDKSTKKVLLEEEFKNLCNDVKYILQDLCEELVNGNVSIKPHKKTKHCDYCEYRNICRKENMV